MDIQNVKIGDAVKIWLPGETPWADVVALQDDGTIDVKVANRLIPEMTEEKLIAYFGGNPPHESRRKLHAYRLGQTVRVFPTGWGGVHWAVKGFGENDEAADFPRAPEKPLRERLIEGIAAITQELKGPMSNVERAWLVADRADMRAELAKLAP